MYLTYKNVLFKDKTDLNQTDIDLYFPDATLQGQMEKAQDTYPGITILSVKMSKVGETTLNRFPDLKYVINRSHGIDNINLKMCNDKNIKVICTYPSIENCSNWILDKINDEDEVCVLIGSSGHIGQYVYKKYFMCKF